MEFKGTPNQWSYNFLEESIVDENGYDILPCGEVNLKYLKSNLKLISKAPEMLEMLIKFNNINSIAREHINEDLFDDLENLIKEATTI